ncbi:hypothetical protein RBH29_02750 [Herbivorax sp. ANBcel31]|uniref:hypothetical protein n=1 Tax=Herbivorax sp. ANBcel31 TaxID=3069754 RepID=UPI0027B042A9|nr:hypothetical protein [Herbivorax sp. ANBcel31]MDQ2085357.1 hypothetical protein [Herbivorax sp. ANBcel31]
MNIKTLSHEYFIVKNVFSSPSQDIYIGKRLGCSQERLFTINKIMDKHLIKKYMPFFTNLKQKDDINELIDILSIDSCLYVIFKYFDERKLDWVLNNIRMSFTERLNIAKSLIVNMMSLKLPPEFTSLMLKSSNLNVESSYKIYFNYFLNLNDINDSVSLEEIMNHTGLILSKILIHDKKYHFDELWNVIENCIKSKYASFKELYSDFNEFYRCYTSDPENYRALANKSLLSKIKEKKKILNGVKVVSIIFIIAGLLTFWIYSSFFKTKQAFNETDSYNGITQIGTVELLSDSIYQDSTPKDGSD